MRQGRIGLLAAALGAAYVAAGAASNLAPAESRALVSLCLITMLSMAAAATIESRPRQKIAVVAAATLPALVAIRCWRRWFDPMAAIGPAPPSLEAAALVVLGVINIAASALVAAVFSADAGPPGSGGSCSARRGRCWSPSACRSRGGPRG